MVIEILHRHGEAAPGGKASYIKIGSAQNINSAKKIARGHGSVRYVKSNNVRKTKYRGLYYISGKTTKVRRRSNPYGISFRF